MEKFVLGSVMLEHAHWDDVAARLTIEDFSTESHRKVFEAMEGVVKSNQKIDRATVANEIFRLRQLEAVGGMSYLVSMDDGLPRMPNLDSYIKALREKTALRRTILIGQKMVQQALLGEVPSSEIVAGGELALSEVTDRSDEEGATLRTPKDIMESCEGGINAFLSPHLRLRGLHFGMPKLQRRIFGLEGGKLIIIAARTAEGKSALALQWALHVARTQCPVLFYTLEMAASDQALRLIARDSGVSFSRLRHGNVDTEERMQLIASATRASTYPIYFSDEAYPTMKSVYMGTRAAVKKHGAGLMVLDQLQLMDFFKSGYSGIDFRSENEALSYIMPGLKNLAKKLNIPVVALSHLTKEAGKSSKGGDPRPTLNMLHGSSAIAKSADIVIFPYREIIDRPSCPELKNVAEFILRKNRSGPLGTIKGRFDGKTLGFFEDEDQVTDLDD